MIRWLPLALLGLLIFAVVSRLRRYSRLFADAHLLRIAQASAGLKHAALARPVASAADEPSAGDDPRIVSTDAGIVFVYTLSHAGADFVHHCSVSCPGGIVAQGALETLLALLLLRLELPIERAELALGTTHVLHAELRLSPVEHAAFAARAPRELAASDLRTLHGAARAARVSMRQASQATSPP